MPNQAASLVRTTAARAANIGSDRVVVHTTYLGGGFGRRAEMDLVREAVLIAREMRGTPVQLIWSREQDIQHDFYRPMGLALLSAGLDEAGAISEWRTRFVSQSPSSQFLARNVGLPETGEPDPTSTENPPYRFADYKMEAIVPSLPIPVGFWRSVGHSQVAFFEECFLDEIAAATRIGPLALRQRLLRERPRHLAVLDRVARESGWYQPPQSGRALGMALHASFGSIVAQVAEISVTDQRIRVHRVACAVDCGPVVNPAIVEAQVRSGINYGLSAALFGEITFDKGRVQQGNFADYDALRLADAPRIDVHIVDTGADYVGGAGEIGTPPIAPAVGNAYFALTGQRLRSLPFRPV
jgi:isoquinoline 1-oxidoreductase beta subunit